MAADERPSGQLSPHDALRQGHWVKLICGASNQDLPAIADLCASTEQQVHPALMLLQIRPLSWRLVRVWIGWRWAPALADGERQRWQ